VTVGVATGGVVVYVGLAVGGAEAVCEAIAGVSVYVGRVGGVDLQADRKRQSIPNPARRCLKTFLGEQVDIIMIISPDLATANYLAALYQPSMAASTSGEWGRGRLGMRRYRWGFPK